MVLLLAVASWGCSDRIEPEEVQAAVSIQVAVSEAAMPLMGVLAKEAGKTTPPLELNLLPPSHSGGALAAVLTSDADLAVLTRLPRDEEMRDDLVYMQLARDGLVFATHPGAGVADLSSSALRAIYSGEVTNWSQLGGSNQRIVVLDRPEHSSPKIALRHTIFGPDLVITPNASELERPGMMDISLVTIPGTIGYTSLGGAISGDLKINILGLDGVRPTVPNVEQGIYPLFRPIGLVIPAVPDRKTMLLVDSVYHPDQEQLLSSAGYSPVMMDLTIGILPEINPVLQAQRFHPMEVYLSEAVGHRIAVRIVQLPSYAELLDEYRGGRIDAAFFGSFTYAVANAADSLQLVARPERAGVSTYKGLILARRDSGIRTVEDLRGKRFSFIAETTAADLFVKAWFRRQGIKEPADYLGSMQDAGSHEASIRRILSGEVDAGAAKDLVYSRLLEMEPGIESELVILAESEPVPDNALAIRNTTRLICVRCHQDESKGAVPPANLHALLVEALMKLESHPDGPAVLAAVGADRFVSTTNEDYANLYRMVRELGIDLKSRR
ncbi:MAG: PhnD/SsuA/transferrin family substrate-binding protein [Acidobacteria bacterium]|uniref:PhnD/SsuA/transferrin family substrate-binding protein n=1 Tax=Candidatus Polarisedimenticola svalbardensis TaxID=2886004 RepID=A0A8J6Y4D1_9BACT|nr:PhnD/SsuA/transferrin family substrate-binding protein [Candidatus Polarisedimenticola svalbardensis]